jgi:putative nucleotidyltransferase with HDIG domain
MKKMNFSFKSFQAKVTAALIISMLFAAAMSNFLIYKFSLDSHFNDLRDKMKVIAQTAALMIDADMLSQVPLTKEGIDTPQYKIIAEKLEKIRKVNRPIKYIYTLGRTEQKGQWQFIVDPDSSSGRENSFQSSSYPGARYNAARFPEMLKAFEGPSADKKLEIDEWGVTLSGYAPILDKDGRAVAVLGVDLAADDVFKTQQEVHWRALLVFVLGIVVSIILGMLISKRITNPVNQLVVGTRNISDGNLKYRVEIIGSDEISELADSFNRMAKNLHESRKQLFNYFYRIVQSLVRILEARDPYTCGHSERVAEYAEKIAARIGFPPKKIELLKETALLHDIGKLGIQEHILNKNGKLNEEEWEIIRKHPVIGEAILKPVVLNDEMLAMVRGHHERYDSKGYPDQLKGENINIFAAIVSVADAYDAMTSARAYRSALSKQKAIDELKKNSGTQFNPEVIDTFLKILESE